MMTVFIIDTFTDVLFKGNPAGVCLLENEISFEIMQSVASELNLSETAFIRQFGNNTEYAIRYFTPTVEIDFCGHATLASAKLLLHHFNRPTVNFTTVRNLNVRATSCNDAVKMTFPLFDPVTYKASNALYEAFGISNPVATKFASELDMLLIELPDKETLDKIRPDFAKALQVPDKLKEVVVTVKSPDNAYDFYSRCFCPWIGINEDPVTGASHSVLAKYWSQILGKTEMVAYQASKRGGFMRLRILNDRELEVVSNAVIVFEGKLNV